MPAAVRTAAVAAGVAAAGRGRGRRTPTPTAAIGTARRRRRVDRAPSTDAIEAAPILARAGRRRDRRRSGRGRAVADGVELVGPIAPLRVGHGVPVAVA